MKKLFCALLALALLALPLLTLSAGAATVEGKRITEGNNTENQNYFGNWSQPSRSYLTETADGQLMRLQAGSYGDDYYYVEYYGGDYKLQRAFAVDAELPRFGAFYATESNYYILSGQNNPDESPKVECYRVTKYDLNWKRIASVGLYDCNTTIPFRAGTPRMTHIGNTLFIRTDHQMYASSDGLNHQANVTLEVDTETMEITHAATKVSFDAGYVSHSLNQFILVDSYTGNVVALDHGDAYPRAIVLTEFDRMEGVVDWYGYRDTKLVPFDGPIGANNTGATLGGFAISESTYLAAYSSVDNYQTDWVRNIYVVSMDKQSGKVTRRQITHLSNEDVSASTPHLVKLAEDSFLLLWSRGGDVYYTELNGKGEPVGEIYRMKNAALSDCLPVVYGDKLVWYTYRNSGIVFREIDRADLSVSRAVTSYAVGDVNEDGTIDGTDYMQLKRYCLGTFEFSDSQKAVADVNGDGAIDGIDYLQVKRHVLGTFEIG